jgi:RimJ/RimL family protein N-acetyltransferase
MMEALGLPAVPGLTLRPCRVADGPFLRLLYRHGREAELAATGWDEVAKRRFCHQQFQAQSDDWKRRFPRARFLLLLKRRQPVGRLYFDETGPELRLIDLSLVPEARGRGFGSAILSALIARGTATGKAVIALSVDPRNPRAHALYRRHGFVETARDEARIHMVLALAPAGGGPDTAAT